MPVGTDDAPELELRDYLRVIRHRKGVITASVVVVVAAALAVSFLQTKVYQGAAEVLLQPRSTETLFDPNSGERNDPARAVQTEIQVLKSRPVRDLVRDQLGDAPKVSANPIGQTDVIEVKAESTSPARAARIANAYARAYIDFRRKQAVDDLLAAAAQVQAKIDDLQGQIDELDEDDTGGRNSLVQQQVLFKQKLDQLQVDAALKSGGAQLVTPADTPDSPIRPTPVRNGIVAFAVGLILGIGIAFLREYLDDSIKSKEDLERASDGLPVLGLIPRVNGWRAKDEARVVSVTDPNSSAAEAYRTLRTSIQFAGLDRPLRVVQVTSPSAAEGKTTTLANLGVALASAGQRVVVVCCDLRRPRIHEFFGLDNAIGFTSALLGDTSLAGALQRVPDVDRLYVMASGPPPPNPSELLSSRHTAEALTRLQTEADIVLVDTPPVLPVTDAAVMASRVDATIIVATAGVTTRRQLTRAVELLRQVDAPLVGTVLNGVTGDVAYGYGYGYGYRYGGYSPSPPKQRNGRRKQPAPDTVSQVGERGEVGGS